MAEFSADGRSIIIETNADARETGWIVAEKMSESVFLSVAHQQDEDHSSTSAWLTKEQALELAHHLIRIAS